MPRITACSTLTFALSSLQTALEHIARYGFDRVEIADMLTHTKHFSTHSSRTVDPEVASSSLVGVASKPHCR